MSAAINNAIIGRRLVGDPAVGSYDATPDDDADLPRPGVLMVMTDGDVAFTGMDGADDVWETQTAGTLIPVLVRRVLATGTTATVKVLVV